MAIPAPAGPPPRRVLPQPAPLPRGNRPRPVHALDLAGQLAAAAVIAVVVAHRHARRAAAVDRGPAGVTHRPERGANPCVPRTIAAGREARAPGRHRAPLRPVRGAPAERLALRRVDEAGEEAGQVAERGDRSQSLPLVPTNFPPSTRSTSYTACGAAERTRGAVSRARKRHIASSARRVPVLLSDSPCCHLPEPTIGRCPRQLLRLVGWRLPLGLQR